jgi:integrase
MIIRTVIDKRRANKEGKYPVKIRITDRNKSTYISLNIYAVPDELDTTSGLFITGNKSTRIRNAHYNSTILTVIDRLNDVLLEARKKGISVSPERLKNEAENMSGLSETVTFNRYFQKFTDEKTSNTKDLYTGTLTKIERYYGKNVEFDDINYTWLTTLEKKLKAENLRINTISIHLRNIRAVYNNALANEIIGYEKYPFRKFKIAKEKTRKRALTIEQLCSLFAYQGTITENFYVDMAKLIFYLRGINMKDLFYLKEHQNGHIYYRRAKTGTLIDIKIEPESQALLDRYKGKNSLLYFCEKMHRYESLTYRINENLKQIAQKIGLPDLTTYVFRHTWATIAAEMDIPKETIAAGLGHSSSDVTDIYIKFNQKKVDIANRQIIDFVNSFIESKLAIPHKN